MNLHWVLQGNILGSFFFVYLCDLSFNSKEDDIASFADGSTLDVSADSPNLS